MIRCLLCTFFLFNFLHGRTQTDISPEREIISEREHGYDLIVLKNGDSTRCEVIKNEDPVVYKVVNINGKKFFPSVAREFISSIKIDFYKVENSSEINEVVEKPNFLGNDLILTTNGDSIRCSVKSFKDPVGYIMYNKDGKQFDLVIPRKLVAEIQANYFKPIKPKPQSRDPATLIFSLGGGVSHRIVRIPQNAAPVEKNLTQQIKNGFCFATNLGLYLTNEFGLNMKYDRHTSYASDERTEFLSVAINYVAGGFSFRRVFPQGDQLVTTLSGGFMNYRENYSSASNSGDESLTGKSFGASLGLHYEKLEKSGVGFGFGLEYIMGKMDDLEGSTGQVILLKDDSFINLNRIQLTVGVRFGG